MKKFIIFLAFLMLGTMIAAQDVSDLGTILPMSESIQRMNLELLPGDTLEFADVIKSPEWYNGNGKIVGYLRQMRGGKIITYRVATTDFNYHGGQATYIGSQVQLADRQSKDNKEDLLDPAFNWTVINTEEELLLAWDKENHFMPGAYFYVAEIVAELQNRAKLAEGRISEMEEAAKIAEEEAMAAEEAEEEAEVVVVTALATVRETAPEVDEEPSEEHKQALLDLEVASKSLDEKNDELDRKNQELETANSNLETTRTEAASNKTKMGTLEEALADEKADHEATAKKLAAEENADEGTFHAKTKGELAVANQDLEASKKLEDGYLVYREERADKGTQFTFPIMMMSNTDLEGGNTAFGIAVEPTVYAYESTNIMGIDKETGEEIVKTKIRTGVKFAIPVEYIPVELLDGILTASHLWSAGFDFEVGIEDRIVYLFGINGAFGTTGGNSFRYQNGTDGEFVGVIGPTLELGFKVRNDLRVTGTGIFEANVLDNQNTYGIEGKILATPQGIPWLSIAGTASLTYNEMEGDTHSTNETFGGEISFFPGRKSNEDNPLNKGLFSLTLGIEHNINSVFNETNALDPSHRVEQKTSATADVKYSF